MNDDDVPDIDIPNLQELAEYEMPEAATCMALSPDNQLLALGSLEDEVIVLAKTLKPLHTLAGHAGGTNSLAFAGNGRLVTAGEDGTACLWDATNGTLLHRFLCNGTDADKTPDGHTVGHVAVSADGSLTCVAAGKTVHLLDLSVLDQLEERRKIFPDVPAGVVEDLKCVAYGNVAAAFYGGVMLWNTSVDEPGRQLEYGTAVYSVACTPDMQWLVAGCLDSCVHIWHFKFDDGEARLSEMSCSGYQARVNDVRFNPAGTALASTGGHKSTVWDFTRAPSGTVPMITVGHNKQVNCQAWQPDAPNLLATGGKDGRVMVYDIRMYRDGMPKICFPVAMADPIDEVAHIVWSTGGFLYVAHISGRVSLRKVPVQLLTELRQLRVPPAAPGRQPPQHK